MHDRLVWIACPIDQTIVRVDEKTGEIADEIADLSGSALVAIGPDAVWTNSSGESGGLARIDPESLEVTYVAGVPDPTSSGGIVVDGTDVWVHGQDDFLTQVGASGEVLAAYTSEELKGGSVFVAFGSVWATADDANTLVRLEL